MRSFVRGRVEFVTVSWRTHIYMEIPRGALSLRERDNATAAAGAQPRTIIFEQIRRIAM